MAKLRTLPKRIKTSSEGVLYKSIVDENNKEVDKIFMIRYSINSKERYITLGKYSDGIRVTYCKNKRSELILNERNGELPPQIQSKLDYLTLDEAAKRFYDNHHAKHKEKFRKMYKSKVGAFIGKEDISKVTSSEIEKLQNQYKVKFSPKYTNDIFDWLKRVFKYANDHGLTTNMPFAPIKRLKVRNEREKYLTSAEIRALLKEVKGSATLELFVLISLHTGCRIGSAARLKASDFDLDQDPIRVTIYNEKTDHIYYNYIHDEYLINLIKNRVDEVGFKVPLLQHRVMKGEDAEPYKRITENIRSEFRVVADKLFNDESTTPLNRVTPHTLRHTYASHLAIKGTSILIIQKLMDHNSLTSTLRYAKLNDEAKSAATKNLY